MAGGARNRSRFRMRFVRELLFWRVVSLAAVAALCFGFAQSQSPREMRFVSADGRQSVVVSGYGITFFDKQKALGQLVFEGVGDGEDLEVNLKLTGQVNTYEVNLTGGEDRLFLNSDRISFVQKSGLRAMLRPEGLFLQGRSGKTKIEMTTPDQGTGGLNFVEGQNLILSLGSLQHFRIENPPRLNAGAIHIGDFGRDPKSRLITAGDSELHTTH